MTRGSVQNGHTHEAEAEAEVAQENVSYSV